MVDTGSGLANSTKSFPNETVYEQNNNIQKSIDLSIAHQTLRCVKMSCRARVGFCRYTLCMALRLLAATTSQGKLRDFRVAAHAYSLFIDPLPAVDTIPAPEEDGETFSANATLKAVYYSRFAPGQLVLADDSGLEVDALGGAPGVRSARFAADSGLVDSPDANDNSDVWNNIVLLQRLAAIPAEARTARYRCVLVAARDGKPLHSAEGAVEGLILEGPRGTGGFGYDPLFYLPAMQRTMAELDLETKLSLSHRGRALAALLTMLCA
jgi:XTP/dITP diphosphohydrolase